MDDMLLRFSFAALPWFVLVASLSLCALAVQLSRWRTQQGSVDRPLVTWAGRIGLGLTVVAAAMSVIRSWVGSGVSDLWLALAAIASAVGLVALLASCLEALAIVGPGKKRTSEGWALTWTFLVAGAVLLFGAWLDLSPFLETPIATDAAQMRA